MGKIRAFFALFRPRNRLQEMVDEIIRVHRESAIYRAAWRIEQEERRRLWNEMVARRIEDLTRKDHDSYYRKPNGG